MSLAILLKPSKKKVGVALGFYLFLFVASFIGPFGFFVWVINGLAGGPDYCTCNRALFLTTLVNPFHYLVAEKVAGWTPDPCSGHWYYRASMAWKAGFISGLLNYYVVACKLARSKGAKGLGVNKKLNS